MTIFTPSAWRKAGETLDQAATAMYADAHQVIIAETLSARTRSPIEAAAVAGDALCNGPWHRLIAGAMEGATSTASKMRATGSDYQATDEAAAAARFWE